jgi:hypothetical protein
LTLEKGKWNASIRDVKTDTDNLKKSAGSWSDGVGKVGKQFTVAGAAITGSILGIIKKTADVGEELIHVSEKTGIAVETLSAYRLLAQQTGTSLDSVARGMKGMAASMAEAQKGAGDGAVAFKAMGISATDSSGKLRPMNDVLLETADLFVNMEDGAEKNRLAVTLFGKAGMEMIPMLNAGREGMEQSIKTAERLVIVFTREAAEGAHAFNDRLDELKAAAGGVGKSLAMTLMPTMTDLIKKVTDTVANIGKWVQAHPALAKGIMEWGLKIGALLTVLGPMLVIIPKIIALKKTWTTILGPLGQQIGGLGTPVSTLSGLLGKLPLVAGAAFVGWKIGEVIGEITGLDTAVENVTTKIIDRLGLWKGSAELVRSGADRTAKTHEFLAQATAKAGREITDINTAAKILSGHYRFVGDELVNVTAKTDTASGAHKKFAPNIADVAAAMEAAKAAGQRWSDFLGSMNIVTGDSSKRIEELYGWKDRLKDMFVAGAVDMAHYRDATKSVSDELYKYGTAIETPVLTTHKWADVLAQLPGTFQDVTYGVETDADRLKFWSSQLDHSTNTLMALIFQVNQFQLALLGIYIPTPDFGVYSSAVMTATSDMGGAFDGLFNDVAQGFGGTFQDILSGATSLKDSLGQIWGNIKDAFFTMAGEVATKWATGLLKSLVTDTGSAIKTAVDSVASGAKTLVSSIGGVAQAAGGLATGIGAAVGSFLGTALAGLIGGGPSGHQQQQQINDTKDSRNYLANISNWLFSAGTGFGGSARGFITDPLLEKCGNVMDTIRTTGQYLGGKLDEVKGVLSKIPKAQYGHVSTATEMIVTHGTPSVPEVTAPLPDLQRALALARAADLSRQQKMTQQIFNINNVVNLDGTIITDREYTRTRLMPEIITALESHFKKSEFQRGLGVA